MSTHMDAAPPRSRWSHRVWLTLTIVWLAGTVAGLAAMATYANRPGTPAQAPAEWPSATRLPRDQMRPTLMVIAHPKCDCTRATLAELTKVMARVGSRARAFVVVIKPDDVEEGWEDTALWTTATQIPGVTVVRDAGVREAAVFGTSTSGQALLYGANGRLLFSGGLTASRGHEGENAGETSVIRLIEGSTPLGTTTPVFGCSLFSGPPVPKPGE
jgi:hypothetical protein